jgi:hypothetical protein
MWDLRFSWQVTLRITTVFWDVTPSNQKSPFLPWNFSKHLTDYTVSHSRKEWSSNVIHGSNSNNSIMCFLMPYNGRSGTKLWIKHSVRDYHYEIMTSRVYLQYIKLKCRWRNNCILLSLLFDEPAKSIFI